MVTFKDSKNLIIVDLVGQDEPLALLFNPSVLALYQWTLSFLELQFFTTIDFLGTLQIALSK